MEEYMPVEKYEIAVLNKAQQTPSQIARILGVRVALEECKVVVC